MQGILGKRTSFDVPTWHTLLFMPNEKGFPNYIWAYLNASPYIDYATKDHKVWISANMQFLLENGDLFTSLNPYTVTEAEFI